MPLHESVSYIFYIIYYFNFFVKYVIFLFKTLLLVIIGICISLPTYNICILRLYIHCCFIILVHSHKSVSMFPVHIFVFPKIPVIVYLFIVFTKMIYRPSVFRFRFYVTLDIRITINTDLYDVIKNE